MRVTQEPQGPRSHRGESLLPASGSVSQQRRLARLLAWTSPHPDAPMIILTYLRQPISKKNSRQLAKLINSHWLNRFRGQCRVSARREFHHAKPTSCSAPGVSSTLHGETHSFMLTLSFLCARGARALQKLLTVDYAAPDHWQLGKC